MNRREALERVLKLRRANLDACRATWARAQARTDVAKLSVQRALRDAAAAREEGQSLRRPGVIDPADILAIEREVGILRTRLVSARQMLEASEACAEETRALLEDAGRSTWGGERALERVCRVEERLRMRRERAELEERFGRKEAA